MTPSSFWSHVAHFAAGAVIVAIPLALANIPQSWQALTLGGLLAILGNLAKSYLAS